MHFKFSLSILNCVRSPDMLINPFVSFIDVENVWTELKYPQILFTYMRTIISASNISKFMGVMLTNDFDHIAQRAFFIPPAFVISSFLASMAALIRDTSLPPTYWDAFISQLSIILTQGFLPYFAASSSYCFIAASCWFVIFLPAAYWSLSAFHSCNFT